MRPGLALDSESRKLPKSTMPAHAPSSTPEAPSKPAGVVSGPSFDVGGTARAELVRIAYRELRGTTAAGLAMAIGLTALAASDGEALRWGPWLALMVANGIYRLALDRGFRREAPADPAMPVWGLRLATAALVSGIGWGASIWIFSTLEAAPALAAGHVMLLIALIAGSVQLLVAMPRCSLAYLGLIGLPVAARLLVRGGAEGQVLAAGVLIFLAYLAAASRRQHHTLLSAIRARVEREILSEQLRAENTRREAKESELREARIQAESASRAKGEFLTIIGHEIRTPMNGVLGMLRIIRDTPLSEVQRNYLRTATDSAEKLLLLLNDVLDFTRLEAGRLELHPAPFPPEAVARGVADLMYARARDKGLEFKLQLADDLPAAVVGDAARLRQTLGNLVGNAIKFTERGSIRLAVTCNRTSETQVELLFTVTDTGIGIDSASLERLFKPFSQADSTLGRRYGGAGLGLAISARLAEAMGGGLRVQTTVDRGTTFRLFVPCPLPPSSQPSPGTAPATPPSLPRLSSRVLVVEDDPVNQQVIDLFLRKFDLSPRLAVDGESAVRMVAEETFDIILMDCQLPGMDGLEATRQIRQRIGPGHPVRILAITANVGPEFREQCLAAGMDDFLPKPVRLEALAAALQRSLEKSPPA